MNLFPLNSFRLFRPICLAASLIYCVGCGTIACRLGPTHENEIAARELARLGLDSMHHGKLPEAKARFLHALQKSPKNPQARHHLAQLLWQQGDFEQAVEEMDTAILHSGGDPDWTVELGRMLLAQGDKEGALRCTDVALQAAPDLSAAWQLRGDVSSQTNELGLAKQAYHRSLTDAGGTPETLVKLSEIYRLEGKPLRALATLQRLEESIPATEQPPADLHFRQALAQQALGRYDDACEMFAKAQQRMGDEPELLLHLGECQWHAGRVEDARKTVALVNHLLPQDARAAHLNEMLNSAGHAIASRQ